MDVVFGILGRTAIRIGAGLQEHWGPPRARGVLAVLLLNAGRAVSIEQLIEWVWTEDSAIPRNPVPTFHTYATRIRRALDRSASPVALVAGKGQYRLDVERGSIDYFRFRTLVSDARSALRAGEPGRAADLVRSGLHLWRGRPLEDLRTGRADDWAGRVLSDEWLPANVVLLEALLALGDCDEVLTRVADLQAGHPDALALVKVRLAALHGCARYTDATEYYLTTHRRLRAESDDHAAEHLRRFHAELTRVTEPAPSPAGTVVPRQLPHATADFVGRERLLRELDAASATPSGEPAPGVVIVDGMPGVGKSALVVHWAHRVRHRFPDGDLHLNLAGFSGETPVSAATAVDDLLIALGHPPDSGLDRRSRELLLGRLLADRRTLVVLDNVRDTAHVRQLIPLLSGSLVVVTSRQRLTSLSALTGARRVRVDPMPDAEAIELLTRRLRSGPDPGPDRRARIARLCGGLPLAITVLAEHVASWTEPQLAEFVGQFETSQLLVEVGSTSDGPANTATFFQWSYDALPGAERRLFRLLAAHPGPDLSAEAATACDGRNRPSTAATLGALVGAHLIDQPDAHDRFRFHDLLRAFARHRLESDEPAAGRQAAERRLIDFYLGSATNADRVLYPARLAAPELAPDPDVTPLTFATPAAAKTWFDRERTNLAAVVRQARDHGFHEHTWRLADIVASYFDRYGYYEDSRIVRELAVSSTQIAGLREWEASSQVGLGMVYAILGDHERALHCLQSALRYVDEAGNERAQAATVHQLARLEMARGDPIAAIRLYRRCLVIADRIDDHEVLCWTHCRLGEALRLMGQHSQAVVHLHHATWFARRIGEQSAHARALAEIGLTYRDQDQPEAAAAQCEQALEIAEAIPDRAVSAEVCIALAEINLTRGEAAAATGYARRAVTVCQETHNVMDEARALEVLGDTYFAHGEPQLAGTSWLGAAELFDRIGNPRRAALIRTRIDELPAGRIPLPDARTGSPEPRTRADQS